jgi:hypothetical protein
MSCWRTKYNGMQPMPTASSHCSATACITLGASAVPAVHRWNRSQQSPVLHSSSTALINRAAAPRHGCHMRNRDCTSVQSVLSPRWTARFKAANSTSTWCCKELEDSVDSMDCMARNNASSGCTALPFCGSVPFKTFITSSADYMSDVVIAISHLK